MEDMFANRGCDGFVVAATHVPGAYEDFVRHVVPELQRRGLFHKDYAGTTLRENLGLPRSAARRLEARQEGRGGIAGPACAHGRSGFASPLRSVSCQARAPSGPA